MAEKGELLEDVKDFCDFFLSKHKSDIMFTFSEDERTVQQDSAENYLHRSSYSSVANDNTCIPVVGIPAHKFILCRQSAVFQAMFNGPLANNADTAPIEDIEPEIMEELLRFVYCGTANLNGNNVLRCVYAARKYDITGLQEKCVEFLKDNIDTENTCFIHKQAIFFDLEILQSHCFKFMLEHFDEVSKTDGFLEVSHSTLLELVKNDDLLSEEVNIFNACINWSENQCRANSLEINPENSRLNLGEIIYQIRFPIMSKHDFRKAVIPTKILTNEEEHDISDYLATTCFISMDKFINQERTGRFITVETQEYKRYRSIPIFGCHFRVHVQPEQTACRPNDEPPLLLLKSLTGSFVPRVLAIYLTQRRSTQKILIEDYKCDKNLIVFPKPIKVSKELNLELQVFKEHCRSSHLGVFTVITEKHVFLTERYLEFVQEFVKDVKCVISEIPTGLTSMTFLK
ncbi:kelch-like protein 8 [Mercenaria mercenaria]|uniref:kelch-like protein 8 n=1 Tax=Mercenaria mercenaria TaxID=6596 RepID=UPI00234F2B3E|nr:kelch-like protein 8 [Mercenaria mercenaria]